MSIVEAIVSYLVLCVVGAVCGAAMGQPDIGSNRQGTCRQRPGPAPVTEKGIGNHRTGGRSFCHCLGRH